jgi:hypothetical protein
LEDLRSRVLDFPGRRPLFLEFVARDGRVLRMRAADQFKVGSEDRLRDALKGLLLS